MNRLKRLHEAQAEIRKGALDRWQERSAARAENRATIAAQGPGAADSPSRRDAYFKRVSAINYINAATPAIALPFGIERRMGASLDLLGIAPSEQARKAGRPVGRIVETVADDIDAQGFASGFLISPDLLITNWHVFQTRGDAQGCGANFLYERTGEGISRGQTFELDPGRFFLADRQLDFAIVGISATNRAGNRLADLGQITLIEARPKILKGQPVNIIQYPQGGPKQYAVAQNRLIDILEDEGFLQYETDTLEGSSGSPAYSGLWEVVALHHSAIPDMRDGRILARDGGFWTEEMGDDAVKWIANEGIRVSAITARLGRMQAASEAERAILASLVASTHDPVPEAVAAIASGTGVEMTRDGGAVRLDGASNGETTMAGIQFTFTGPVTINMAPAVALAAVPTAPASSAGLEASIRFDPDYDGRAGYAEGFLDEGGAIVVPIPQVGAGRRAEILNDEQGDPLILKYHHFELMMNRVRRLQMWSAVNVDYAPGRKLKGERKSWGSDRWIPDPRIAAKYQVFDADFYKPAGNIDRGHIVRREDNEWGDDKLEIEYANSDTFHWTNCTPQHEAFNQSTPGSKDRTYEGMEGIWGAFENHIQQSRKGNDTRACILAGPILAPDDPSADFGKGAVPYPIRFFKIVCVVEPVEGRKALKVFGSILSQRDVVDRFGIERFEPGRFSGLQTSLANIEEATGLVFDPVLHAADVMAGKEPIGLRRAAEVQGIAD